MWDDQHVSASHSRVLRKMENVEGVKLGGDGDFHCEYLHKDV